MGFFFFFVLLVECALPDGEFNKCICFSNLFDGFPPTQSLSPSKVKSEIPDGLTSGQISHNVLFQPPL